MNARKSRDSKARLAVNTAILSSMIVLLAAPMVTSVVAQTQVMIATPNYINLGMTTSISVTAPAAGAYTVVVDTPKGGSSSFPLTFSGAGQTQDVPFGNATTGFQTLVKEVGTYNVFLEQGGQVVASTSFSSTNKLNLSMDMVNGGLCNYIAGATRGTKMFPRFYVTYASNGAPINNNITGIHVTYTYPDGTMINASWHKPTVEAPDQGGAGGTTGFFIGKFQPNWNYTHVGPWIPSVTAADAYGNTVTYKYSGPAFDVNPATLATNVHLVDAKSGQLVTGLYDGQDLTVTAVITYPTNAEPVSGFVAPLDSAARGGVVNALVGWGFYNATSNSFGSATMPGGLISQVALTYTGANGTWTGNFKAGSLPSLQPGTNFVVVVSAADKASPPNTGLAVLAMPPATIQNVTTTSVSTVTSVTTTVSASTSAAATTSIPTVVYAGMAILLVIGLIIGYIVKVPRR